MVVDNVYSFGLGITLPIYLDTVAMLAGFWTPGPFWFMITVAITSLYVIFGANAAGRFARDVLGANPA